MTYEELMEIVEKVVSNQLRDATVQTDRDELRNVAILGILEAKKSYVEMEPGEIGRIAKHEIINFKLSNYSNVSIPKGSLNYIRKRGLLKTDSERVDEVQIGGRRLDGKRQALRYSISEWRKGKNPEEQKMIDLLMEGLTVNKAWGEMWEGGFTTRRQDATYELVRSLASELKRLLRLEIE